MEKRRIDLDTYPRKEHFLYFKELSYPYVGATVQVDITDFMKQIKEAGQPFFLSFLYRVLKAGNAVPQFRQRIEDNGIVEYDYSQASCVIMKEDEAFAYCTLDGRLPLEEFLTEGRQKIEEAKNGGTIEEDSEVESMFFISCLPWLTYSALVQAVPMPADSNVRISWGKYQEENGKITIPISVLGHHALIDGLHIGKFFKELEKALF